MELEIGGMFASRVSRFYLNHCCRRIGGPNGASSPCHPTMASWCPRSRYRRGHCLALEAYAAWHRMSGAIHTIFSARMLRRGVARNVCIELPIGSPREVVEFLWSHEFCDRVCDTESGAIVTNDSAAPRPIQADWSPMLHFADEASIDMGRGGSERRTTVHRRS